MRARPGQATTGKVRYRLRNVPCSQMNMPRRGYLLPISYVEVGCWAEDVAEDLGALSLRYID